MEPYIDPILKKYKELIEGIVGSKFKMYYYGDPVRIGASSLPALILSKTDTIVSNETNQEDRHSVRIQFTIVADVRDSINDDKQMVKGINELYNLMEGRDTSNYTLKAESLLGILRNNVELDIAKNLRTDIDSMSRVDYGLTAGKRSEEGWGIEGVVEIVANFIQIR